MEKFNITNLIKRELARKIKERIKNVQFDEFTVMYSETKGFYIVESFYAESEESHGNVVYKGFQYNSVDGNLKLTDIEKLIFG